MVDFSAGAQHHRERFPQLIQVCCVFVIRPVFLVAHPALLELLVQLLLGDVVQLGILDELEFLILNFNLFYIILFNF